MIRSIFVAFLGLVLVIGGWTQTTSATSPTPTPAPIGTPTAPAIVAPVIVPVPKPYTDDEFPLWVRKIRRAEIIAVGAFPIAYMLSGVGYDYFYYLSNDYPSGNIPWPAGPGTSQWTTSSNGPELQTKNLTILASAAVIGVVIATIDWLLSP